MGGCGASGCSTPGDRMSTCLDGENPRHTASSCWLTFRVRDWPLRARSPPVSPPHPLRHLPMRGSVGAPPGERGRKGGGGEGRKKGRSQAGIPKGRGLSRSLRAEEVRRPGPSSRRPRPRRCLLGPPCARCPRLPRGWAATAWLAHSLPPDAHGCCCWRPGLGALGASSPRSWQDLLGPARLGPASGTPSALPLSPRPLCPWGPVSRAGLGPLPAPLPLPGLLLARGGRGSCSPGPPGPGHTGQLEHRATWGQGTTLRATGWVGGRTLAARLPGWNGLGPVAWKGPAPHRAAAHCSGHKGEAFGGHSGCPGPGSIQLKGVGAGGGDWRMGRIPAQRPPSLRQCLPPRTEASRV